MAYYAEKLCLTPKYLSMTVKKVTGYPISEWINEAVMLQMIDSMKKAVKNWWVSLLVGILAIIMGVWCFMSPGASLIGMTYVFIIGFLLGGLDICFAVLNRNYMYGWGWSLAGGIFFIKNGYQPYNHLCFLANVNKNSSPPSDLFFATIVPS